jgi:glycosyltransferase involved in cell wall biosynthesis
MSLSKVNLARRTRVLHIVPDLGVGGLPRVVETLCLTVDPERFESSALCLEFVGALGEGLRTRGFRVDLNPGARHPDRLAPFKIARYLLQNRFDVVHTHNTQAFIEGLPGAILARVPNRVHTDHARLYPDSAKYILSERILSNFATHIVAVSDHTSSDLQRYQRIPAHRIITIPNGVDGKMFTRPVDTADVRRRLGLSVSGPILGIVSRLVEQKGIIYLLRAMVSLVSLFPDLHLVIAGEGDLEQSLRASASELGLEGHAHFLGVRRDTPELLNAVDIFMLPSVWEGLPMTVLEAMAASRPIIASEVGGVSAAVKHKVNGLLIAPGDPAAIVEAVSSLLRDRDRMSAYGAAGSRIFQERFSAEAMTRAYETLYLTPSRSASLTMTGRAGNLEVEPRGPAF